MNIILFLLFVVSPFVFSNTQRFGDINFIPTNNKKLISSDLNQRLRFYEVDGVRFREQDYQSQNIFTYGLGENININFGLDYIFSSNLRYNRDNPRSENNGLQKTSVGGLYRILGQKYSDLILDVLGDINYRMQNAQKGIPTATTSDNGNAQDPSHKVHLGMRLGKKFQEHETSLNLGVINHRSTKLKINTDVDYTMTTKNYSHLYARLNHQIRFVQEFAFEFVLGYTQVGSRKIKDNLGNSANGSEYAIIDYGGIAKYFLTSNFAVNFNYLKERTQNYNQNLGGDFKYKNHSFGSLGFGLDYLF